MITGLDVPEVTNDLLSQIARSYDLGPLPIINGRLWSEKWSDCYDRTVEVAAVYNPHDKVTRWAVRDGNYCLSKSGEWQYEPSSSRRTTRFLKYCRFNTAKEAAEFYFAWKAKLLKRAAKMLKKDPNAIINL